MAFQLKFKTIQFYQRCPAWGRGERGRGEQWLVTGPLLSHITTSNAGNMFPMWSLFFVFIDSLERTPKGEKRVGEFKTSTCFQPTKQVPNSISSQKKNRFRPPSQEKPNLATEGRLSTRCPYIKISAHCFLKTFKKAWRQMPVFTFSSFLVLSSNKNTQVPGAHCSVDQKVEIT